MSSESKDFDHYAIVLADLKAKKAQIEQAIQAIESLRGVTSPTPIQGTHQASANTSNDAGDYLGMTIPDAAIKLLKQRRKQMTNSEILAGLQAGGMPMTSADPLNTVGAVITRRSKDIGDIVKLGRGVWGLKEWYPNRSFNKPAKNNGDSDITLSSSGIEPPSEPDPDDSWK